MGSRHEWIVGLVLGAMTLAEPTVAADGDAEAGARAFRVCAACHSLEPGHHLTGPSLAGFWGRRAGTIDGFTRYSRALKSATLSWSDATLDAWLAEPTSVVAGNRMPFRGIKDSRTRADLIAFLKVAGAAGRTERPRRPAPPDLKTLSPQRRVVAIRYCGDTYHVTTADGEAVPYWEFNLRFKNDASDKGPVTGRPALLRASMMGDRAFVIFAAPDEISPFIEKKC